MVLLLPLHLIPSLPRTPGQHYLLTSLLLCSASYFSSFVLSSIYCTLIFSYLSLPFEGYIWNKKKIVTEVRCVEKMCDRWLTKNYDPTNKSMGSTNLRVQRFTFLPPSLRTVSSSKLPRILISHTKPLFLSSPRSLLLMVVFIRDWRQDSIYVVKWCSHSFHTFIRAMPHYPARKIVPKTSKHLSTLSFSVHVPTVIQ